MSKDFVQLFKDSVAVTLEKLFREPASFGTASVADGADGAGDVTIVVGIVGPRLDGLLAIALTEKSALKLAGKMIGKELSVLGVDAKSALSEFGNILSAIAITRLTAAGVVCDITTPSVHTGRGLVMNDKGGSRSFSVPIFMDSFSMVMTLSLAGRRR